MATPLCPDHSRLCNCDLGYRCEHCYEPETMDPVCPEIAAWEADHRAIARGAVIGGFVDHGGYVR